MKRLYIHTLITAFSFAYCIPSYSQIGIGTSTPQGMLDITSTNSGFVYPMVSLTRTDTQTILNPNTGLEIVEGTTVYNTNISSNGAHSVYEGLYVWDVSNNKWIPQFSKKDYVMRSQNSDIRTASGTSTTLSFDNNTFTPKYSGIYKITLLAHYGGGQIRNPRNGYYVNFAAQKGEFTFIFNSNSHSFSFHSYSAQNRDNAFVGNGNITQYIDSYTQSSYVIEESLIAGTTYTFTLELAQATAPDFTNNGSSGSGQGYIREQGNVKYNVEFEYINE